MALDRIVRTARCESPLAVSLVGTENLLIAWAGMLSVLLSRRLFARVGFAGALVLYALVFLVGFAALSVWPSFSDIIVFRYLQSAIYLGIANPAYHSVFNIAPAP